MHRHARFPATSRRRRAFNGRSPAARPTLSRAAAYFAADNEKQGRLARPPQGLRLSREGSVSRSRPLERAAPDAEKRRAASSVATVCRKVTQAPRSAPIVLVPLSDVANQ